MKVVARWIGGTTALVTGSTAPIAWTARLRFDHGGVAMGPPRILPRRGGAGVGAAAEAASGAGGWEEAPTLPSSPNPTPLGLLPESALPFGEGFSSRAPAPPWRAARRARTASSARRRRSIRGRGRARAGRHSRS